MEHLNAFAIFAKVAELSSFSKAAESLGLAKSTVSKTITELERAHGLRLLYRSPRHLSLTEEGYRLLQHCQTIELQYDQAVAELNRSAAQARGLVRVSAPQLIGQLMLAHKLPALLEQHLDLAVDLDIRHANITHLADHMDLVIIFGELPDSSMVATRLAEVPIILCASPGYLARHGDISTPEELSAHETLLMTLPNLRRPNEWHFTSKRGKRFRVNVKSRLSMNDTLALKQAMLHDGGIVAVPPYVVAEELAEGTAIQILADYKLPAVPVFAVFHSRSQMPPKIRTLIEFIRQQIKQFIS